MLVIFLAADVRIVGLDDTLQKVSLLDHRFPDTHEHEPCGVLVHFNVASELARADAFARVQDERDGEEPALEVYLALVENGPDRRTE
jgi:hypothetical protein